MGPYDDETGPQQGSRVLLCPGLVGTGPILEGRSQSRQVEQASRVYPGDPALGIYVANLTMLSRYDALNGAALQHLVEAAQVAPYGEEILDAAKSAADELYSEFAAADADFRPSTTNGTRSARQCGAGTTSTNRLRELCHNNLPACRLEKEVGVECSTPASFRSSYINQTNIDQPAHSLRENRDQDERGRSTP